MTIKLETTLESVVTKLGRRSGGEGHVISMDTKGLPSLSVDALLRYAFQRFVNDKVGGSKTTLDEKIEKAEEIVAQLREGWVGRVAGTGEDPIAAYVRRIVRANLSEESKAEYDAIPSDDQPARKAWLDAKYEACTSEQADAIAEAAEEAKALDEEKARKAAERATKIKGL